MAKISLRLFTRPDKDGKYPLRAMIYHHYKKIRLKELVRIDLDDWDETNKTLRLDSRQFTREEVYAILDRLEFYKKTLRDLSLKENLMTYTPEELRDKVLELCETNEEDQTNFYKLVDEYCELRSLSYKSQESYNTVVEKLKEFSKKPTLKMTDIDNMFLENFANWMKKKGNKVNTVALYMRNIRTICNYAINANLLDYKDYPFRVYKIKTVSTRHRTIDVADIQALVKYDGTPAENVARDLFMLSIYLRGINFKDLLYLKKKNVYRGRIFYKRSKTQNDISVKIEPEAKEIFNKYRGKKQLLYFIEKKEAEIEAKGNIRKTEIHADIVRNSSKRLKRIFEKLDINVDISTYFARHTWATFARKFGDYDIVQQGLGHSDGRVTAIYIKYDDEAIDETNRKVIDYIFDGIN